MTDRSLVKQLEVLAPKADKPYANILANTYKSMDLDDRQKNAVLRFTSECGLKKNWGILLLHKVGTGKTISSLLIALNNIKPDPDPNKITEIIIISPIGIFGGFVKDYRTILNDQQANVTDTADLDTIPEFQTGKKAVLIDYDYDMLINDINNKKIRYDFKDKIVIFDEAHRLLTKTLFNSIQASNVMDKHSFFEDQYFINNIYQSQNAIILTGTPMQMSAADLCIFSNFITRTDNFVIQKYAARGLAPSTWIFLARHWKFINGVAIGAANIIYKSHGKEMVMSGLKYVCNGCEMLEPIVPAIIVAISTSIGAYSVNKLKKKTSSGGNKKTKILKTKFKKNITKKMYGGEILDGENLLDPTCQDTNGSIVYGIANFLLSIPSAAGESFIGKFAPAALVNMFYTEPKDAELKEIIYELEEPQYNMKLLAEDMSNFISIYDYELQDKKCNSENLTEGELDTETPTNFPKKIILKIPQYYNEEQLELQYKFNLGILNSTEKRLFNKNKYAQIGLDINVNKLEFLKVGKFVGNYSLDVLKYYTKMDSTKYTRYQALTRDYDAINSSGYNLSNGITSEVQKSNIFECPKFEDIIEKLKYFANHDDFFVPNNDSASSPDKHIKSNQPHSYVEGGEKVRYLPLIYSYTEDYGTSLIACYLESLYMPYVLIHKLQKGIMEYEKPYYDLLSQSDKKKIVDDKLDLLEYNKLIAFSLAYKYEEYNSQKNEYPFCVILDPTMTEGLNATFNPAIFVMEPCNSFGDHEQVYGRVLRKYNKTFLKPEWEQNKVNFNGIKQFPKLIYQYIITSANDFDEKYPGLINKLQGIFTRANDLRKIKGEYLQYSNNPSEYIVSSLKFKFGYPDEKAWKKITREEANLFEFERSVKYNIYCSDIGFTQNCEQEEDHSAKKEELETKSKFNISDMIKLSYNKAAGKITESTVSLFNIIDNNLRQPDFDKVEKDFEELAENVKENQTEEDKEVTISQILEGEQPQYIREFETERRSELCVFLGELEDKAHPSKNFTKLCINKPEVEEDSENDEEETKKSSIEKHQKSEQSGKVYCDTLKKTEAEYTMAKCERFENDEDDFSETFEGNLNNEEDSSDDENDFSDASEGEEEALDDSTMNNGPPSPHGVAVSHSPPNSQDYGGGAKKKIKTVKKSLISKRFKKTRKHK